MLSKLSKMDFVHPKYLFVPLRRVPRPANLSFRPGHRTSPSGPSPMGRACGVDMRKQGGWSAVGTAQAVQMRGGRGRGGGGEGAGVGRGVLGVPGRNTPAGRRPQGATL